MSLLMVSITVEVFPRRTPQFQKFRKRIARRPVATPKTARRNGRIEDVSGRQYWVLVWSACTPDLIRLHNAIRGTNLADDPSMDRVLLSFTSSGEITA